MQKQTNEKLTELHSLISRLEMVERRFEAVSESPETERTERDLAKLELGRVRYQLRAAREAVAKLECDAI